MVAAKSSTLEHTDVGREIGTAVKHSLVYGFGSVIVKLIGFVLLPLYTHYLSPHEYGILEILDLSMSLFGMVLMMGITAALLRYYGSAETEDEKRRVFGTMLVFAAASGSIVFAVGSLFVPKVSLLLFGATIPSTYLFLAFANLMIGFVANVPYVYLRAKEASGSIVTLDSLGTFGMLVLTVYFLAVLKLGVLAMLISPIIVGVLRLGAFIIWLHKEMVLRIDWPLLRRMLVFGAPLVLSNITMFILNFSDRFFLKHFQSLDVVGIYATGYKFGYLINLVVVQPFNMMWQSRMYSIHKRPDHRRVFSQIFVLYSCVLLLAALGVALFSSEILRLMVDPRYASATKVVPVVSLGYVLLGVSFYVQSGMYLGARTSMVGIVSAVVALLNIAANGILIWRSGMIGAAWATLIGFLAMAVISYYWSERALPLRLPVLRVAKAGALAGVIYFLGSTVTMWGVALSLLIKTLLLASFPVAIWLLVLSREEIKSLEIVVNDAAARFPLLSGWWPRKQIRVGDAGSHDAV